MTQTKPAFWYGIPRGYLQLDLAPSSEHFELLAEQVLGLPAELREKADQVFRFYAGVLMLLNQQQVQGCAMGLHPDGCGGILSSVITVSSMSASGVDPKLVIAGLVKSADQTPEKHIQPLELPCGTGFLFEEERITTAPGKPSDGTDELLEGTIWQGTVAVPAVASSEIVMMQLVTSEVDFVDDYRNVLLGFASTLTFTDPSLVETESRIGDSAAHVRSPFG
ncbi:MULTISPECIES: hypothetical protein [Streptomyces]|uniref:Uncharacterized protein n=1 Tax=Streptomyces pseudovenezuelae TaxID=67350 RepID=A0A124H9M5_9ACTN|nr:MULTISPECIES: hypothetical protein [Streptomyces]KUM85401.1 hypothetical protein AQI94_26415 [Streptomyces pseudovenezuelae]